MQKFLLIIKYFWMLHAAASNDQAPDEYEVAHKVHQFGKDNARTRHFKKAYYNAGEGGVIFTGAVLCFMGILDKA